MSWLLLLSSCSGNALDAWDYLIQKVCVDNSDHVLPADPLDPPAGSHLRNLRAGEALPYYKHDQPAPGKPDGFQRHDSYPVVLRSGERGVLNPFDFGENYPGNGYDLYGVRDGWASASETRDGGGFSTTFFGRLGTAIVPGGGWVLFPTRFVTGGFKAGSAKIPLAGRYWEHDGEPWPGKTPASLFPNSETSWRLIKDCSFGGVNGNPFKKLDAIQSVHGYVSKPDPAYESNMRDGHLEVFYFTQAYGVTRWEVWTALRQFGDLNQPSDARAGAIQAAHQARPLVEAGQRYFQPADLPQTAENRLIEVDYTGDDGEKNTYALSDIRDWSAVTILASPAPPPPCPLPSQNLLRNFHFDGASLTPWVRSASPNGGLPAGTALCRSRAPLDTKYEQEPSQGGVRYLALRGTDTAKPGGGICQDIPVAHLKDGVYTVTVKLRSEAGEGVVRLVLQQVDARGVVLTTESDANYPVSVSNQGVTYQGPADPDPAASVFLASKYVTGRAKIAFRAETLALRFSIEPKTDTVFDLVDANVSEEAR